MRSCWLVALLLALGAAPASRVRAQDYDQRELSAQEQAALAAGELVTRPMRVQRGALLLIGGSSWQVIDAPPELVWRTLHDVAHYPQMLPRVLEASVVATRAQEQDIYLRQGLWPIFTSYYLTVTSDAAARSMTFKLDDSRPHAVRAGWGFVRLLPYPPQRTLVAFGILGDAGHGIIAWFARSLIQRWMLKIPWTVKRFIETHQRAN